MRVISGKARGTILATLEGTKTRPTTDRVKESLFNLIQFRLRGAAVLDLFAGSGALGIEAASRGAASVMLVENFRQCHEAIEYNVKRTGLENITLLKAEVLSCFTRIGKYDVIIMDPPYSKDLVVPTLEKIVEHNTLNEKGVVVVEHSKVDKLPERIGNLKLDRQKKYGIAMISIYSYDQ